MLNRSSPRVTAIPCLNALTIKLKGKTKRNNGQSDILSVLLELLFQQLPSFCLETFKCLNELIVPRVGTEPNIVAMIITGFVDNLFILEEFALWPSQSKQCLNEQPSLLVKSVYVKRSLEVFREGLRYTALLRSLPVILVKSTRAKE